MATLQGNLLPLRNEPPPKPRWEGISGGDNRSLAPVADRSSEIASAAIATTQAASFLTLRLWKPELTRRNQFKDSAALAQRFPDADKPDATSAMGTPVYGRILLGKDGGDNKWTDAQGKQGSYKTVALDCALCNIDFNNKIVKTDIQGLPYSITEFMSSGDNDVTITGVYNSTPGVAPMDFIINLNHIFSAPVPIPVTNYYLNANNIFFIKIVPGTTMGQVEGEYATQRFTIRAWSDVPMTQMLP